MYKGLHIRGVLSEPLNIDADTKSKKILQKVLRKRGKDLTKA
jgi:hypothetical protein